MQSDVKVTVTKELIGPESVGQRLDNFLFRRLKGVPKSRVYRMLRDGEVRVSGRRAKPEYKLAEGDLVRIPPARVAEPAPVPAAGQIEHPLLDRVVYRDDALLVIDKPAGQAVHGGSGVSLGVIEQLRLELSQQHPPVRYLELAHRLDKETSGILVLATKRAALVELHRMLRDGEVHKRYLALATGKWRDALRHVKLPLQRYLNEDGERRVAVEDGGQRAHTIFRLQQRFEGFSLLEAELKTGRTHQIRVHLAALGYPIACDDKYGDPNLNKLIRRQGLKRMFLHAARLEMLHPITKAPLVLEAPLPGELAGFLAGLPGEG
ncbi:MAG: RluA family pseudouridine synthase [Pseudomonadota bacterium]